MAPFESQRCYPYENPDSSSDVLDHPNANIRLVFHDIAPDFDCTMMQSNTYAIK
jgi:hypothetical protein